MIGALLDVVVAGVSAGLVVLIPTVIVVKLVRFIGSARRRERDEQLRARRRRAQIDRELDIYNTDRR